MSSHPDAFAIVGIGCNSQETPALVFKTEMDAADYLISNGMSPKKYTWEDNSRILYHIPSNVGEGSDEHEGFFAKFYTTYYGGCGEIDSFEIRPIHFGKPFAVHDLD